MPVPVIDGPPVPRVTPQRRPQPAPGRVACRASPLLEGEHELAGRRSLADEWYQQDQAPTKHRFVFPNAGHAVAFEQHQALNRIMSTALADADAPATR